MFKIGYAQEIITPPTNVGLAGYFNKRPNQGMYDDIYVKVVMIESKGKKFGFMSFELCSLDQYFFDELNKKLIEKFGREIYDSLIVCATHTHTGSNIRKKLLEDDERARYAFNHTIDAGIRALERALMNLLPGELEVGSVYNNPFGFVRRYWMKNGTLVTNPRRCDKEIDKPESDFDRTIGVLAVKQGGRIAALICNIVNHGDTIGGDLVSADWYGRFAQEIQHELKTSLPVMVLDDASGNVNHFDLHQDICQTSYEEAVRIGRGYASIVLGMLNKLTPVTEDDVEIKNTEVEIPHRKITPEELAEAKNTLATVPDIKKDGDFESQDLANKVPAALRYFAQRVIDCHEKSTPSNIARLTSIKIGKQIAFVSLPGEPFNGIGEAIRKASPCKYTFIAELAQSDSGYVPMPECFPRGGYEVQANIDSTAQNAATVIIDASIANL